jgi:hypothetical protein
MPVGRYGAGFCWAEEQRKDSRGTAFPEVREHLYWVFTGN